MTPDFSTMTVTGALLLFTDFFLQQDNLHWCQLHTPVCN